MMGEQTAREVVDLITGAWRTQALYSAVSLRLPDHVAAGSRTTAALALKTGTSEDGVRRLMRLLVALGVFDGEEETGYRPTSVSVALESGAAGSMRDMCLLYGQEFYRAWGHAQEAISASSPSFERACGRPLGEYLEHERGAGERFLRAMNAGNIFFEHLPRAFDFSGCSLVVDVGGGSGELLSAVMRANPDVRGVLVDLHHMLAVAEEHLRATAGLDRVQLVAGDIFASVPSGGDVYLLSRVLQDWDDDRCLRLLANCRRAMGRSSRLLVVERVVRDDGSAALPLLWDLHLLIVSGGRERTLDGYAGLLTEAGLRLEQTIDLPLETTALVARPV
ncbi:MAG: methyltransferase [Solirubrobacteraceae bacterium]